MLQREWFDGKKNVGVTAGAGAPEVLGQQVIQQIKDWGVDRVEEGDAGDGHMVFALPKELRE